MKKTLEDVMYSHFIDLSVIITNERRANRQMFTNLKYRGKQCRPMLCRVSESSRRMWKHRKHVIGTTI